MMAWNVHVRGYEGRNASGVPSGFKNGRRNMKAMSKDSWKLGATMSLAALLGMTGQAAQAAQAVESAMAVSAINATANASGQAFPYFVFQFNTDFDLAGFEVTVEYQPAKLSFNAASSTLAAAGSAYRLPEALAMMEAASVVPGTGPDFFYSPDQADFGTDIHSGSFNFNGAYLSQTYRIAAGSTVVMMGVFNLQPGFDAGNTQVRVFGQAIDPAFNSEPFDVTATVSAVPEPETWLMVIGGLGLIASRVRRRAKR